MQFFSLSVYNTCTCTIHVRVVFISSLPLQTKFGNEVLSPYQEKRAVYEDFRSKVQLLPNKQLAEESFRKFEEIAKSIEGWVQTK